MVRDSKAGQVAVVISILMLSSLAHGGDVRVRDRCILENRHVSCHSSWEECKADSEDVRPFGRRAALRKDCRLEFDQCVRDNDKECRCYDINGLKLENCASDQKARTATNPRYVIKGDTVYDKETNLTWMRCSLGQEWKDGIGCAGIVKKFMFDEAQAQGGNGWRMPSQRELMTLIDKHRRSSRTLPTIDTDAFPGMDLKIEQYWTSTPSLDPNGWGVVGFLSGFDGFDHRFRSSSHAVRLVRDAQ